MSLSIYADQHVKGAVTRGLRLRGVTVLTAAEDGTDQFSDPDLLDHATALGYVLFTHDQDFLAEAAQRQAAGVPFAGVVFAAQLKVSVGQCVNDLELLAKIYDPPDMRNRLVFLPL